MVINEYFRKQMGFSIYEVIYLKYNTVKINYDAYQIDLNKY